MKKLLALLLSCAMITVACASCDKDEKKEKESKAESSAVSDDKDDKDDKEDDDKDDKKDEESKKDKEDKEDSKKDESSKKDENSKKDESSKGSASVEDTSICGDWTSEELFGAVISFGEDGVMSSSFDYSSIMCFNKDGKLEVMGQACDTEFDGETIKASTEGQEVLSLKRKGEKDDSTMDGEYEIAGGMNEEDLATFGDGEVSFIIEGEKLIVSAEMGEYTADGKTLVMKGGSTILSSDTAEDGEDVEESCEYKIEGDTLTLIMADDEGESVELTRVK